MRLVVFFLVCGAVTTGALAHEGHGDQAEHSPDREAYTTNAGYVLGTYTPITREHSAKAMAEVANRFLDVLDADQRRLAAHSLRSAERQAWTNTPARGDVGGLALSTLTDQQLHACCDLLATVVSAKGYAKIVGVMLGDDKRAVVNGKRNRGVGIGEFRIVVFGTPDTNAPWGLQLDGHHLALNLAIHGAQLSMSPTFVGTRPQRFKIGDRAWRPLEGELDDAHALLASLDANQRRAAIQSDQRGKIRSGPGTDGKRVAARGVQCDQLTGTQQTLLLKLIENWVSILPPVHADRRMGDIRNHLSETWFAWHGETRSDSDISFSIVGPTLIIEFACQDLGGNPLDHLHTMYRNPTNEYGGQLGPGAADH